MILLRPIIEVEAAAVLDLAPQLLSDRTWVSIMAVSGRPLRPLSGLVSR
jgi:hypothetical protein